MSKFLNIKLSNCNEITWLFYFELLAVAFMLRKNGNHNKGFSHRYLFLAKAYLLAVLFQHHK